MRMNEGQVYTVNKVNNVPQVDVVSGKTWAKNGFLGFSNGFKTIPLLYQSEDATDPTPDSKWTQLQMWVAGHGLVRPPKPATFMEIWFDRSDMGDDEEVIGSADQSLEKEIKFTKVTDGAYGSIVSYTAGEGFTQLKFDATVFVNP